MSESVQFKNLAPNLVVPDVVKTAEYYRDVLGFEILGYFLDPPVFSMVRRGRVELHFGKSDGENILRNEMVRRGLGTDVYIFVEGIEALHSELKQTGANILTDLTKRPYGCVEFEMLDCDGHKIVFGE